MIKRIRSIDRISQYLATSDQTIQLSIGELTIVKLIGQGSSGHVFHCRLGSSDLAIKFIARNVNVRHTYEQNLKKSRTEYINLVLLDRGADIAKYVHYDVVKFNDEQGEFVSPVILMERYDGTILDFQPKRTYRDFVRFFDFLIDTVGFLHNRNIAHNDIRANNILIKGDNFVLADFGIASFAPQLSDTQSADVTKSHNKSHDIYAIGKVLLFFAMGKNYIRPVDREALTRFFPDENPEDVIMYDKVIGKCLDRNPQTNFKSITDIKDYCDNYSYHCLLDQAQVSAPVSI